MNSAGLQLKIPFASSASVFSSAVLFAVAGISVACTSSPRETAKAVQDEAREVVCPVVGIKTTKVFFTRADKGYDKTMLGEKTFRTDDNRQCFVSAELARSAGYKWAEESASVNAHRKTPSSHHKNEASRDPKKSGKPDAFIPNSNAPDLGNSVETTNTARAVPGSAPASVSSALPHALPQTDSNAPAATNENADNSKNNRLKNGVNGPSAEQQSNASSDVEITRKIRRSLTSDNSLSTYAHNVKIVTRSGEVLLVGPVRSAQEKEEVLRKATSVAGNEHVKSELEVTPR